MAYDSTHPTTSPPNGTNLAGEFGYIRANFEAIRTGDASFGFVKLGIGLSGAAPSDLLHIQLPSADTYGGIRIASAGTGGRIYNIYTTANGHPLGNGLVSIYDATAGSHRLIIDSAGLVGIGIVPTRRLHVLNPTAAVNSAQMILQAQAGGYGTGIEFGGYLSATTTYKEMAKIVADAADAWTATAGTQDAMLSVWTTLDGTLTRRATFDQYGNFHVGADSAAIGSTQRGISASNGTEKVIAGVQTSLGFIGTFSNHNFALLTNNAARMTVDTSGNVGINTTADSSYKLDVKGTIRAYNLNGSNKFSLEFQADVSTAVGSRILSYDRTGSAWKNLTFECYNLAFSPIGQAPTYGSGIGVVFVGECNTIPSANPTGGGVLYVQGGALKYRGTSGTVTTLGPA